MSTSNLPIIQGLWVGPRLSSVERLSVCSFLAHGHEYHLYVYDELEGVPAGTTVKDAREILPADRIFRRSNSGSYEAFSDFFRYKLLFEKGDFWADLDTIALRPFDFPEKIVISSERSNAGCRSVNNGMLKFPAGSPVMETAWRICAAKRVETLGQCELGPELMEWLVNRFDLHGYVQEPEVFCPIHWHRYFDLTAPECFLPEGAYSVHFWNDALTQQEIDKDAQFPPTSLYERLKARYLHT